MRIAFAGGGTGGHVVPGLHLVESMLESERAPEDVLWFGAGRGIEARVFDGASELLADLPFERVELALEPPSGGAPSLARLVLRLVPEILRARRALAAHRTELVVGLGGYTSLPAVIAARSRGLPTVLIEINAVRGRATRWLAPLAKRVFHAWPSTLPGGGSGAKHVHSGPPLSAAFGAGAPTEEELRAARRTLGFEPERPLLLVLGGSQGALGLNRFLRECAPRLTQGGLQVLHQAGPGRLDEGAEDTAGYRCVEYLDDVATALGAATLVLSRGGASTLAEIAARARPVLVVPYPHHADRHQERNARGLGDGAAIVDEAQLDAALVERLLELAGPEGESRRSAMTNALSRAVPADASASIARELFRLWEEVGGTPQRS